MDFLVLIRSDITISFCVSVFLGLVFGSFATALVWRVPRGISWIYDRTAQSARSACPVCGMRLGVRDLVPVFSWMFLRGKCRGCGAPISPVYPAIELSTLAGCLGVWFFWGMNLNALLMMLAVPFLVALVAIDLKYLVLPDQLVAIAGGLGALRALWSGFAYHDPMITFVFIISGFLYMLLAWGLRAGGGALIGREALGLGDVKFFGAAGVWLGLGGLPFFLLASGLFGVVFGLVWRAVLKNPVFPFGPALIAGFYGVLIMMAAL